MRFAFFILNRFVIVTKWGAGNFTCAPFCNVLGSEFYSTTLISVVTGIAFL